MGPRGASAVQGGETRVRAWTRPVPAALLTITAVLAYGPLPARALPPAPVITWAACPENEKVQCGTMLVPADWAKPAGPSATLTIARLAASDPHERIGSLLVNPGGPGGSAVDMVLNAGSFFTGTLRRHFDIVGMDPRGVGRSAPVLCSQDLVDQLPSPMIETQQAYDDTVAYNRKLAADCAAHTGPVFTHVDSGSVARDMDAVRAALGENQISFYGASYGTLLGEQYAQRYPKRLRALALDSVMDHSVSVDDFLTQETDAAQDSFGQFIAWCARDTRCVVRGQDIRKVWAGLMARARAGTLEDPYDRLRKLRLSDLLAAAFAAFYDPQWYSFAYYLRDAQSQTPATGKRAPGDLTPHSFPAVFCADWSLPESGFPAYRAKLDALAARAPQILASPLAVSATAGCLGWPTPAADPQAGLTPAAIPVMLVNAEHDPATAYPWAVHVTRQLGPRAVLLRYRGWGHVAYDKTKCVSGLIDHYLITLATPAPGTTCKAVDPEPFGVG
jgi:pimeloyl-ACP methyl ester carboxylesterase